MKWKEILWLINAGEGKDNMKKWKEEKKRIDKIIYYLMNIKNKKMKKRENKRNSYISYNFPKIIVYLIIIIIYL
jgi:hypothetical protein